MDDEDQLGELLAALDSASTADKRVAALQNIQTYIEEAEHIPLADQLTSSLKAQLKNQNHLVSSLTLSILPAYVAKLAATALFSSSASPRSQDVKATLEATLAAVLEKLGDQKEKIRDAAKATIIEMAKAAFAVSPSGSTLTKDSHTAVAVFEKIFKDSGLSSRLAKVKEQTTLVLIPLRKAIEKFPLRPILPCLVEQLSDADQGVREAARTACINLFSSASPTAKSELKKEMEKKGVRKQTADAILAEVLGGATASILDARAANSNVVDNNSHYDGGERKQASLPARSASRMGTNDAADDSIKAVYIASQWDLDRTMTAMLPYFEGKETEHNWLTREQSVVKIRGMLKTGVHESLKEGFSNGLRQIHEGILKATASLRTTLSMHGLQLISELAHKMREGLDPLAETFVTSLIKMAGFTKKIVANGSQMAVQSILKYVTFRHKLLDLIWQTLHDKTVATRVFMCDHLITMIDTHGRFHRHAVESHGGLEIIEKFCQKALPDQNKDVREKARLALYKVEVIWPRVAESVVESLDAATRKQVDTYRGQVSTEPAAPNTPQAKATPASARKSMGTGPSHAILAAKRAAAARLALERKNRQEAEASAQLSGGLEAEEDKEEISPAGRGYNGNSRQREALRRLQQEADNEAEADSTQQLMDENERGDIVDPFGERSRPIVFPTLHTPRSPLLRSSDGSLMSGHDSAPSPTSSSVPMPVSPRFHPGPSSPPSNKNNLDVIASRARKTSTSSASSARSTGRRSTSESQNVNGRFESFGQRVNNHTPTTTPLSVSGRDRTSSSSSPPVKERVNAINSPTLRNGSSTSNRSSLRPSSKNRGVDELKQPDSLADISTDSMSSRTGENVQAISSSPGSLQHHQARSPSVSSARRQSRLPRPVSVLYQGSSSPSLLASRPTRPDSIGPTSPTASSPIPLSPRQLPGEMQTPLIATPSPASKVEGGARIAKTEKAKASSSSIKWFLGKASRLDHVEYEKGSRRDGIDVQLSPAKKRPESEVWIGQLQSGQADLQMFKGLASICKEFKLPEGSDRERDDDDDDDMVLRPGKLLYRSTLGLREESSGSNKSKRDEQMIAITMWQQSDLFERLFQGLSAFLCADASPSPSGTPSSKDLITAALIVLHRLVENQFKLFEVMGKERDLIQLVFELIKAYKTSNVKSACQAIMESWNSQTNAIMGISTLRGILTPYLADAGASTASPSPSAGAVLSTPQKDEATARDTTQQSSNNASTIAIHTSALRNLARLFQRLPVEVVEEEVERCKVILKKGLNHWNIETRQQAVAVLVAANGKVKDPKSLFSILQPMERAQEDLLMYYMSVPS